MPRKTKEKINDNDKIDEKKSTVKKSTTKASPTEKKSAKTVNEKKSSTSRRTATSAKKTTSKKTSTKADDKEKKPSAIKKGSTKASSAKKTATRKSPSKKANKSKESVIPIAEYYDLPYKYGNTLIKLLAQTPNTLFVYWEVSDSDIEALKKAYGDDFFYKTKPILIVHNLTLDKHCEVEINDFANCWYLNTEDSDCKFDVELARKLIQSSFTPKIETYNSEKEADNFGNTSYKSKSEDSSNSESRNDSKYIPEYVHIAKSNDLQSPNDHILFEKINEFVVFKDVSTGTIIKKNIKSFKFLKDLYRFYKEMYNEEIEKNPSSQFKF